MKDFLSKPRSDKKQGTQSSAGKEHRPPADEAPSFQVNQGSKGSDQEVKRKILVVAKDRTFSAGVMDYAINLAERLGYDLVAMNVNPVQEPAGRFFSGQGRRERFLQSARAAWAMIDPEVTRKGIQAEHVVKFGDVAKAVKELSSEKKRIDFVIADAGIRDEEMTGEIPLPVFNITGYQGEKIMAKEMEIKKVKPWGRTIAFGLGAAALYAAVFTNAGTVMKYFTRGSWYAALPVATVFIFSFVHGAFANYLWTCLGVEATKKVQPRVEVKRPVARKRPRPQLRVDT